MPGGATPEANLSASSAEGKRTFAGINPFRRPAIRCDLAFAA